MDRLFSKFTRVANDPIHYARNWRGIAHRYVWRKLPIRLRRRALHLISRKLAPRISIDARPTETFIVVGMLKHTCGLGAGARLCYQALEHGGLDVYGVDVTAAIGQPETLPHFKFRDGRHIAGPATLIVHFNAHMMASILSQLGQAFVKEKFIVGYWAWELEQAPPEWREGLPLVHRIWVTSSFTQDALSPLVDTHQGPDVLHHPVAVRAYLRPEVDRQPRPFTVLSLFDMGSTFGRKNPLAVVAAFQLAFGNSTDARLLVKVGSPTTNPQRFDDLIRAIGDAPNIEILTDFLSDEEVANLFRTADCYLSLPRSEGFGLTFVEAMLSGIPVVGTAWGGQTDFLTPSVALIVQRRLIASRDPDQIYDQPHLRWAEADTAHAAELLRELYENPHLRASLAARARCMAMKRFSAEKYLENVHRLMRQQQMPRVHRAEQGSVEAKPAEAI